MTKKFFTILCLFTACTTKAQYTKLLIVKGYTEKFCYKLGYPIRLMNNDNRINFGIIHFITEDSIYLDVFDKVALKDITSIEPMIYNQLEFTKIKSGSDALVGAALSLFAVATFQPYLLPNIWTTNDQKVSYAMYKFDDSKLTNKEKRRLKKQWKMGTYKLVVEK